mgnify:FL=1
MKPEVAGIQGLHDEVPTLPFQTSCGGIGVVRLVQAQQKAAQAG